MIRFGLGSILYPVITVVGLFSVVTMYVLYIGVIVYYIVDQTQLLPVGDGRRRSSDDEKRRYELGVAGVTTTTTSP